MPAKAAPTVAGVRKDVLDAFRAREAARYAQGRPKSAEAAKGAGAWLGGVPMHWMADWPMPHLPLIDHAQGARIKDIDGFGIDDFFIVHIYYYKLDETK